MRNIPEKLATTLSMDVKRATTTDEMQSVTNVYMHGSRTGLPRGTPGPMIVMTETDLTDKTEELTITNNPTQQTTKTTVQTENAFNAATKGNKKDDNTKGSGMANAGGAGNGVAREERVKYS